MGKNDYKDVHTMIGTDAVIQGNVTCQGGVAVYGKVFGDVVSEGPVRIARGGEVHGNVQANDSQIGGMVDGNVNASNADISGELNGAISVSELLSLKSTAKLDGDIIANKLAIEPGASFTGSCSMGAVIKDINHVGKQEKQEKTA